MAKMTQQQFERARALLDSPDITEKQRAKLRDHIADYALSGEWDPAATARPLEQEPIEGDLSFLGPRVDPQQELGHTGELGGGLPVGMEANPARADDDAAFAAMFGRARPGDPVVRGSPENDLGKIGQSVYSYQDPSVEEAMQALQQVAEQTGNPDVQSYIEDLRQHGKRSRWYQGYADQKWQMAREVFEKHGAPAIRASEADVEFNPFADDFATAENWASAVAKVQPYAEAALGGLDAAATLGLGREALGLTGNVGYGDATTAALDELQELGLLGSRPHRIREEMADHPVAAVIGGVRGLQMPGVGGNLARGMGQLDKAVAQGLRQALPRAGLGTAANVGARTGLGAAGGALGGAGMGIGERAVAEAGEALRGENEFDSEAVLDPVEAELKFGGILGGLGGLAGAGAQSFRDYMRSTSGRAFELKKLEEAGGGTGLTPTGLRRTERMRRWQDASVDQPYSAEHLAMEELAPKAVAYGQADEAGLQLKHKLETMPHIEQHAGKSVSPNNTFRGLWNIVNRRKDAMFEADKEFKRAIGNVSKVRVVGSPQEANDLVARFGAGVVMEPGDPRLKALGLAERFSRAQDEYFRKTPNLNADVADMQRVVVLPKPQSITDLEESVGALNRKIRYDSEKGVADKAWEELGAAIRQDRRTGFGDKWADIKARQSDELAELSDAAMGIVGAPSFESGSARSRFNNAFRNLMATGQDMTPDRRMIRQYLERDPALKKMLLEYEGLDAFRSLRGKEAGQYASTPRGQLAGRGINRIGLWGDALLDPTGFIMSGASGPGAGAASVAGMREAPVPEFVRELGPEAVKLWESLRYEAQQSETEEVAP